MRDDKHNNTIGCCYAYTKVDSHSLSNEDIIKTLPHIVRYKQISLIPGE